jgi:hypothetical protein
MKIKTDDREPNLIGIAVLSIIALSIAWHLSTIATIIVLIVVYWALARTISEHWWRKRARAFGRELECRAITDLERLAAYFKAPVRTNVPVPGLGDADAILGRGDNQTIVEIKAFRSWDPKEQRCQETIEQVERLKQRLGIQKALIWLPQGELTLSQRLGVAPGLPKGTRLVNGPAWRPLLKTLSPFGK